MLFPINQQMVKQNHSIVRSRFFFIFNFLNSIFSLANSIRLETEQEEKRLLQDQFRQLEISTKETHTKLLKQIDNVKDFIEINHNSLILVERKT